MTLAKIKRQRERLHGSRLAFETQIRLAVENGCRKVDVAKAAGVSRPTLDKILNQDR